MSKLSRILLPVFVFAALALSACAGAATPASTAGGSKVEAALVEFTGVIEAIDGNQWTVNGQIITVDPSVVADGPFNVGDTIKVEAEVAADGTIIVTKVEAPSADDNSNDDNGNDDNSNDDNENEDNSNDDNGNDDNSNDDDENEVVGVVTAMDETTITIDGQVYSLADFTEIKDTIQVNDTVKLHFIVNADGTLTVSEVELSDPSDIGDDNENDDNSNDDNENEDNSNDDNSNDDNSNSDDSDDDDGGNSGSGGGGGDDDGGDDDDSGSDDD